MWSQVCVEDSGEDWLCFTLQQQVQYSPEKLSERITLTGLAAAQPAKQSMRQQAQISERWTMEGKKQMSHEGQKDRERNTLEICSKNMTKKSSHVKLQDNTVIIYVHH